MTMAMSITPFAFEAGFTHRPSIFSRCCHRRLMLVLMDADRGGAVFFGQASLTLYSRSALSAQRDAASFCSRICSSVSEIGAEPRSTLR
jgi:hypothetical protein